MFRGIRQKPKNCYFICGLLHKKQNENNTSKTEPHTNINKFKKKESFYGQSSKNLNFFKCFI